jgi:CRISPR type III-B/RAMP module-associated protein Cmr5
MPTGHQRRAERASVLVAQVPEAMKRRYNALAHKLPVLLRTNGLVQVLAFLRAKAGDKDTNASAERRFAEHLGAHLQAAGKVKDGARVEDVHTAAMKAPYADYLRMQEEAVACAAWHKRFSAARFGEVEED